MLAACQVFCARLSRAKTLNRLKTIQTTKPASAGFLFSAVPGAYFSGPRKAS